MADENVPIVCTSPYGRRLLRPWQDYLGGYERPDGKWVPGVLESVQRLQKFQSYVQYATFVLVFADFFGVRSLHDLITFVKSI